MHFISMCAIYFLYNNNVQMIQWRETKWYFGSCSFLFFYAISFLSHDISPNRQIVIMLDDGKQPSGERCVNTGLHWTVPGCVHV